MARSERNYPVVPGQRIYAYWQALFMSFYSHLLYWDVYKRWRGFGILFLLMMVFVLSIPYGILTSVKVNRFFNDQLIAPIQRLPDIYYVGGTLVFDKKMPYYIKNQQGKVETIIDSSGKQTRFDRKQYPDLKFLFTQHKILFSMPDLSNYLVQSIAPEPNKVRTLDVPKDIDITFNGDWFLQEFQLKNLKRIITTAVYPLIATVFFILCLSFLLPLAMMGQVISQAIFKVQLYYKTSCRLLSVSSTPAFFVLQWMVVSNYYRHYTGLVWLGLMAIYFSMAVILLKRHLKTMARL